jgi:hypothetical protein
VGHYNQGSWSVVGHYNQGLRSVVGHYNQGLWLVVCHYNQGLWSVVSHYKHDNDTQIPNKVENFLTVWEIINFKASASCTSVVQIKWFIFTVDSSVGTATCYGCDGPAIFLAFSINFLVQGLPGFIPEAKRQGGDAANQTPSNADVCGWGCSYVCNSTFFLRPLRQFMDWPLPLHI